MTPRTLRAFLVFAAMEAAAAAQGQPAAPGRGELLYTTHCIACHDTQVHWRDGKRARDWNGLKEQVRRWQEAGRLGWEEADIDEVARYLNQKIYLYPQPPAALARH